MCLSSISLFKKITEPKIKSPVCFYTHKTWKLNARRCLWRSTMVLKWAARQFLVCPEAEVFFSSTYTHINIIEACPKLSHSSLKHLWTCPKVSCRNEIKTSFISISTVTNTFYSALFIFFTYLFLISLFLFFPSPSFPIPQKKGREYYNKKKALKVISFRP